MPEQEGAVQPGQTGGLWSVACPAPSPTLRLPVRLCRCSFATSALCTAAWRCCSCRPTVPPDCTARLFRLCPLLALPFEQVLSRDIRPVHRRIESPLWADVPAPPPSFYDLPAAHPTAAPTSSDGALPAAPQLRVGRYHVVLEGIDVSYDVEEGGRIVLRGACPNVVQSQQRGLGLLLKGPDAKAECR